MKESEIVDLRGEIIVNNAKVATQKAASAKLVHDVHILVDYVQGELCLLCLYTSYDINYCLNILSLVTGELRYSFDLVPGGMKGWAPRMYKKDDDTIRCMYGRNNTGIFYQDFSIATATFSPEKRLQVAIKKQDGSYEDAADFTRESFLTHLVNVSGVDYRDTPFGGGELLVEDTQQLQQVDGKYYMSCEILAEGGGFCAGIACAMWSDDLDVWHLNNPVSVDENLDNQRDHEISITYLNGQWHALSRVNRRTAGPPSGYQHYTSPDAENWTCQGLASLPDAFVGIRHAIFVTDLKYAAPRGDTDNRSQKQVAFVMYQKIPATCPLYELDHTNHKLRSKVGLVYTEDFEHWVQVADLEDRDGINYPSITLYHDRLYMAWTSSFGGNGCPGNSIMWSSYSLGKI